MNSGDPFAFDWLDPTSADLSAGASEFPFGYWPLPPPPLLPDPILEPLPPIPTPAELLADPAGPPEPAQLSPGAPSDREVPDHEPVGPPGPVDLPVQPAPVAPDGGELPNYDPALATPGIIGDPAADMSRWHEQHTSTTCAVASQEFVLDSLGVTDFSEEQLAREAEAAGWYTADGGTPMAHVGKLLEYHGLHVERAVGSTVDELRAELELGHKVIVGVDSSELWTPGRDGLLAELGDLPAIPGQGADHAVEVIGFIPASPEGPMVILNDPGHPEGRGMLVEQEEFDEAWADSGHFAIAAWGTPSDPVGTCWAPSGGAPGPTLSGYHNADGTYHWTSDDTDRDPETGAIVRQW